MLYGGVAWSELPISTSKDQQPNGEIFDFGFTIDQNYGIQMTVDPENIMQLDIQQAGELSIDITQRFAGIFKVDQQINFTLEIDENNTWSLG
jgi:hypothetical protein